MNRRRRRRILNIEGQIRIEEDLMQKWRGLGKGDSIIWKSYGDIIRKKKNFLKNAATCYSYFPFLELQCAVGNIRRIIGYTYGIFRLTFF